MHSAQVGVLGFFCQARLRRQTIRLQTSDFEQLFLQTQDNFPVKFVSPFGDDVSNQKRRPFRVAVFDCFDFTNSNLFYRLYKSHFPN